MRSFIIAAFSVIALSPVARAETHGGVMTSNGAFKAVVDYALQEGGSLARVFGISKLYRVPCGSDLYEIKWGSMSNEGIEHASSPTFVSVRIDGETPDGSQKFAIEVLDRPACPKP